MSENHELNSDASSDVGSQDVDPFYPDFDRVDRDGLRAQSRVDRATGAEASSLGIGDSGMVDRPTRGPVRSDHLGKGREPELKSSAEQEAGRLSSLKRSLEEAQENLGNRCTTWLGDDAVTSHPDNGWDAVSSAIESLFDSAGAVKDFGANFAKMYINNFSDSDKFYHCMANCEAASRGASGANTAKQLSCAREAFDVVWNTAVKGLPLDYTLTDSPKDMEANRTGIAAGRSGVRCEVGCSGHRKNWPEPRYR